MGDRINLMPGQDESLKKNNSELIQLLFDQSDDGIMVIDGDGVVQLANPGAVDIFSASIDQLQGHQFDTISLSTPVKFQVNHNGESHMVEMRAKKFTWQGKDAYLAKLKDISEQNQAKNELWEGENQYRQLFNHSMNGIMMSKIIPDEAGNPVDCICLDVNQAFENMFGISKGNILNKSFKEQFPRQEWTDLLNTFRRVARTGKAERCDFNLSTVGQDVMIAVHSLGKGTVAGVIYDLTEGIGAENELHKSEMRYKALYEMMSQGVIYLDEAGKIQSFNTAAENILGLHLNTALGKELPYGADDIIRLDLTPYPENRFPHNIALRTGRRVEDVVMGLRPANRQEPTWLNVSAIPLFGEEFQIVVTMLDITDRIRIQKALQERVRELNCIAKISNAIQKNLSISEICHVTLDEVADAMQFPEDAYVVIELAGDRFVSQGFSEDFTHHIKVLIRIRDQEYGYIAVYYSEKRPFIFPEEFNLLSGIAERLASYYEHWQIQGQLQRSEERFRRAILDAPIPIMLHAEDGEILFINHAWIRSSGYSREEVSTLNDWLKNAHREKHEEIAELIQGIYQTGQGAEEVESHIIAKNGEKRLWQITTSPLETLADGRKAAISMARDITKRRKAELEREKYFDRINALREVDQVVGSTLDLDNVLDRVTSELKKLIAFDSMAIMLINHESLEIIACQGFDNPDKILGLTFPSKPEYPNYEVIVGKKPVCYENISDVYPRFSQPVAVSNEQDIKTWLGVPLIHQDEVIGIFTFDRYEENLFSEDDIAIALEFANRAAIAISNAQLYKETIWQIKKLEILRKIDAVITGSMNLHSSLMEILTYIQNGLKVDAVSIVLYDEERQMLFSERGVGFKAEVDSSIEIKLGQGFSGHIALDREPLFIPDVTFKKTSFKYPVDLSVENITSYYGLPLLARGKMVGVLQIYKQTRLDPDEDWISFADALAGQAAIAVYNISLYADLEQANKDLVQAYDATIEGWAHALELRDKETVGHSRRVVDLSLKIAQRFGFTDEVNRHIHRGVLLHDIGKMGIPDEILQKPGPLTEEEWDIMRQHPGFAFDMLKDIKYLRPALTIPHYHHERWNGSGYPDGLVGEEIPLEARIFAVVDIWDALISDRYYRPAWTHEKALAYIREEAGRLLDPDVVAVFLEIVDNDPVLNQG